MIFGDKEVGRQGPRCSGLPRQSEDVLHHCRSPSPKNLLQYNSLNKVNGERRDERGLREEQISYW